MSKRNRADFSNKLNYEKPNGPPIDDLISQAFKDDLPADAENAMRRQLNEMRRKMEQLTKDKSRTDRMRILPFSQFRGTQWVQLLLKKEVLIAASLLMIVFGGFLQSSGYSNSLKKSLSILGTSVAVSSQINQVQSMVCSIQMPEETENPLSYSIQWLSPNLSRIKVSGPNHEPLKTIWISEDTIVIADHLQKTLRKEKIPLQHIDPMLQPIAGYLSPAGLTEQMTGAWQLKGYEQKDGCQWGTFTVSMPEENAILETTVDLCTYLPASIKKIHPSKESADGEVILTVHYSWNEPISSEVLCPNISKESQNT